MSTIEQVAQLHGIALTAEPIQRLPIDRVEMLHWFREMGLEMAAEVGVWRGYFSREMCRRGFQVIAIDPWQDYPGYARPGEDQEENFKIALRKLQPYGVRIIREKSPESAQRIPDAALDLVYLDGNHSFFGIAADLAAWHPKVRAGGVVAGHDFYNSRTPGPCDVRSVVLAWCEVQHIDRLFMTANEKHKHHSWFYVK